MDSRIWSKVLGASVGFAGVLVDVYANGAKKQSLTNNPECVLARLVPTATLAQRASSTNSITPLCAMTGAEVSEASKAIGMDSRVGPSSGRLGSAGVLVGSPGRELRRPRLRTCPAQP